MKIMSMSDVDVIENKFFWSFLESHKKWVEGINDLQEDRIGIMRLGRDVIWNKVDSSLIVPLVESIEVDGTITYRINFPFNSSLNYPIKDKNNSSVVFCGDNSTIGFFYQGKIDSDADLMKRKYNLINALILKLGREKYGEKRLRSRTRLNVENKLVRNDIVLDGKKISGIDLIADDKRFEICALIQNRYTEKEKATIEKFMSVDPHWEKSYGNRVGITGLEIDFDEFTAELRKMLESIYENATIPSCISGVSQIRGLGL